MSVISGNTNLTNAIRISIGIKGFLRYQLINKFSGKCRWDSGFFPNKLLTTGINVFGTQGSWLTHCRVGTNNTAPSAGDTQLYGQVAQSSTLAFTTTWGAQGSPPYYGWKRITWRFNVGAGHGGQNLQEGGVGYSTTGSTLISRALIIDPITQLPTSVTPLADEVLDVTYEMRYYPPLADALNTVTLLGVAYNTTTRAANVTSNAWSFGIGSKIGKYVLSSSSWRGWNGTIGDITSAPNGVPVNCDNASQYDSAYVNNSHEIVVNSTCGPSGWNASGGLRSINITTTAGDFKTEFSSVADSSAIPKSINHTMAMAWVIGWAEKV